MCLAPCCNEWGSIQISVAVFNHACVPVSVYGYVQVCAVPAEAEGVGSPGAGHVIVSRQV